jgi:hypothetical protein
VTTPVGYFFTVKVSILIHRRRGDADGRFAYPEEGDFGELPQVYLNRSIRGAHKFQVKRLEVLSLVLNGYLV